jgi:uncharacterized membrane protein
VIERNVRALVEHFAEQERSHSHGERIALSISRFIGSMKFVYLHIVVIALWILGDLGLLPGIPNYDTTFAVLGTVTSIEAIFLATFVLIAQNRMAAQEEIRNHLDVQVSLLNEHETTHILRLVTAIADKMGLEESRDPSIQELLRDLEPQEMIDRIAVQADAVVEEIRGDASAK